MDNNLGDLCFSADNELSDVSPRCCRGDLENEAHVPDIFAWSCITRPHGHCNALELLRVLQLTKLQKCLTKSNYFIVHRALPKPVATEVLQATAYNFILTCYSSTTLPPSNQLHCDSYHLFLGLHFSLWPMYKRWCMTKRKTRSTECTKISLNSSE